MPYLTPDQYPLARPFFAAFEAFHPSVQSVLYGESDGTVWVDDLTHPRVAYAAGPEGYYLGGDPACTEAYAGLREVIPQRAYLLVDPPAWEPVLHQTWKNIAFRRHHRQHYLFRAQAAPEWRSRVPVGMRVVPVDADFFEMTHLENHGWVMDWVNGWRSHADFLRRGAGACVVHGERIASWSMMDFAVGDRCEIGIITAAPYRRQGLATIAVSAALEACLALGYREIGWQCFSNNVGSIGTARRTGFVKERDYVLFSSDIPSENAGDMTRGEYKDWALHYERAAKQEVEWAFLAAQAWSMAGEPEKALANLRSLKESGWHGKREWFERSWRFEGIRGMAEFKGLVGALVEG